MSDQLKASHAPGPDITNTSNRQELTSTKLNHIQGQISRLRMMVEEDRHVSEQIRNINAIVKDVQDVGLQIIAFKVEAKLSQMHGQTPDNDDAAALHGLVSSAFRLPQSR